LLAAPLLSRDRLDRSRLWPTGPETEPHEYASLLAIHATATSAGTASVVFEAVGSDGRRAWLLYIADRQTSKGAIEPSEPKTRRARAALEHVKREQRFELWLWERMRERTTIHLPRLKEALEPREAVPLSEGGTDRPGGMLEERAWASR